MFGIILKDYDGDVYAHLIKDKAVWDWAHQDVTFPPGKSSVPVSCPPGWTLEDGEAAACITIGSADNDLLIMAAELIPVGDDGDFDNYLSVDSVTEAVLKLTALGVTAENIEEGLVY